MRVNVYNEEILRDHVILKDKEANGVIFSGVHFFFGKEVEHTPGDDDSSAIVFWYSDEHTRSLLRSAFSKALKIVEENAPK